MLQLDMSGSEQKIQALRDRLQGENDDLQRENDNRRRPGRAAEVNPSLVPLLRGEAIPALLASNGLGSTYGLEHATPLLGIAVSVILSIPLWGVLGLVARAMLR